MAGDHTGIQDFPVPADFPNKLRMRTMDQFHMPMRHFIFKGDKVICDSCIAGDFQGNPAADPGPFCLIPLRGKSPVLTGSGTECDSVMGFINPVECSSVIMDITDHDDQFIVGMRHHQVR